jgi:hypothetical protein
MTGDRRGTGWLFATVGALLLGALAAWAQSPKHGGTLRVGGGSGCPRPGPPSRSQYRRLACAGESLQ